MKATTFEYPSEDLSGLLLMVPGVEHKADLLSWYNVALSFPISADNWDALEESLRDLSWIVEHDIWLHHNEIPLANSNEKKVYLKIMESVAHDWIGDQGHAVRISFLPHLENQVSGLVA